MSPSFCDRSKNQTHHILQQISFQDGQIPVAFLVSKQSVSLGELSNRLVTMNGEPGGEMQTTPGFVRFITALASVHHFQSLRWIITIRTWGWLPDSYSWAMGRSRDVYDTSERHLVCAQPAFPVFAASRDSQTGQDPGRNNSVDCPPPLHPCHLLSQARSGCARAQDPKQL